MSLYMLSALTPSVVLPPASMQSGTRVPEGDGLKYRVSFPSVLVVGFCCFSYSLIKPGCVRSLLWRYKKRCRMEIVQPLVSEFPRFKALCLRPQGKKHLWVRLNFQISLSLLYTSVITLWR